MASTSQTSQFRDAMSSILHQTSNEIVRQQNTPRNQNRASHRQQSSRRKLVFGSKESTVSITVKELYLDMCWVWPCGLLLAEYLFANPNIVTHQTVLEMGAGCGLPSFMCCKLGAQRVYASDAAKLTGTLHSMTEMA